MKALCWQGKNDVQLKEVPVPKILNPKDAILKITLTAICGSDLHLYDGMIPTMEKGDILGHEFMGEIVEIGSDVKKIKVGDRVVIPFNISCGSCSHCADQEYSACDNSNPNAVMADKLYGSSGSALFGYSHLYGGYAGGQTEYVRVPFIDVAALKIPNGIEDEKVLFLSDIFPTGFMAADNCQIKEGDIVAVWGCGPVGQFAIRSAFMLGAERVIAIDNIKGRLAMAAAAGAETIDFSEVDEMDELKFRTGGRGPDACIDAVGMEAHGAGVLGSLQYAYDKVKTGLMMETDRPIALRQALQACRKGGTVSIPGVYGGLLDKIPFGAAFGKGLTLKMGQTHTHRYMPLLLDKILKGDIDPSFVISHRLNLADGPDAYKKFRDDKEDWIKVVMRPQAQ